MAAAEELANSGDAEATMARAAGVEPTIDFETLVALHACATRDPHQTPHRAHTLDPTLCCFCYDSRTVRWPAVHVCARRCASCCVRARVHLVYTPDRVKGD